MTWVAIQMEALRKVPVMVVAVSRSRPESNKDGKKNIYGESREYECDMNEKRSAVGDPRTEDMPSR